MELTVMQTSQLTYAVAVAALLAGLSTAAEAQDYDLHHRLIRHPHQAPGGNDIMVTRRPDPLADAFRGPAAIITGPVAIAGTIVSLPFRVIGAVFPPRADDPRVIVGAPVYAAGEIAQFPFVAVNGIFGMPMQTYY